MQHRDANYHPGISMHHIKVGGCVAGAIFALGTVLMVLLGIPVAKWFLLGSVIAGIAVFFLLRRVHRPN
jgi:hypothetical protein